MKYSIQLTVIIALLILSVRDPSAYTSYTGYSGSPGRQACSVSCHHIRSFAPTITVTGFPESYLPGQQYTIAIAHNGGSSISQFNASIRVGTGTFNA